MFNWYRNSYFPSYGNYFSSDSGFGNSSYRYNRDNYYPWRRYRPTYNRNSYRPYYNPSWWWDDFEIEEPEPEPVEPEEPEPTEPEKPEEPEPEPEPEVPPEPLAIEVNSLQKGNKIEHYTSDFGESLFAVRRGQAFTFKLTVNRKHLNADHITLVFSVGPKPQGSKNTRITVHVENQAPSKDEPYEWSAYISEKEETSGNKTELTLKVKAAADCVVGRYHVKFQYRRTERGKQERAGSTLEDLYILFNAWCKDDQVYLESNEERKEYVLNQTGRIYTSDRYWENQRAWSFEQFSKTTIEAAIYLLLKCETITVQAQSNPTKVARAISAMVNSNDENGVLSGNWSGDYADGTSPVAWVGSLAILEEYMKTKQPVRYGQCWVFSGLVTSLGRSLGIPTRSVTNFNSAHDHDGSMTIDYHFDARGESLRTYDDSVWNFHVWNEGWFKRPDLPDGYDGWQAFDATPQERSEGILQCGPASLKCIKEGDVYLGYDAGFIYAEINGSRVYWTVKDGKYTIKSIADISDVGKKISTKAVGKDEREYVTHLYKYPEGSADERRVDHKVMGFASNKKRKEAIEKFLADKVPDDVEFTYNRTMASNLDISVEIGFTNKASQKRSFDLLVSSHSAYYTGVTAAELSDEKVPVTLEPNQSDTMVWRLKSKEYLNIITGDATLKIIVMATVKPTNQCYIKQDLLEFPKPALDMTVSNAYPKAGEEISVTMSFNNPVDLDLTEGIVHLEGPGITKERIITVEDSVPSFGLWKHTVLVTPKYPGDRELIAVFNSKQLVNITGAVKVHVQE